MPRKFAKKDDDRYQRYMDLCMTDPDTAAMQYSDELKQGKKTIDKMRTIRNLQRIMDDDTSAWHAGASSKEEAVQFLISGSILKGRDLGVDFGSGGRGGRRGRYESVEIVANMISEDVNFESFTPMQKRLKMIAESYGFIVYKIPR